MYDRHGSDPDSRFAGMSNGGGHPGFATSSFGGGGPTFEGEISPEDLFNMFFGGGGGFGGMPMGGGPGGMSFAESEQSLPFDRLFQSLQLPSVLAVSGP